MPDTPRIAKLDFLARRRGAAFALRIDDVTAIPNDRGDLLVEVEGEWDGPHPQEMPAPVLVVDDGQRSHRFTAIASPSPLGLDQKEVFRARFAVSDDLESCLVEPLVLFVGKQAHPLPDARVVKPTPFKASAVDGPGPAVLAERRADRAEQSERLAHDRADRADRALRDAEHELVELERRLTAADELRREAEANLQEQEREHARELRAAAQRVHAEQQLREETLAEAERLVRESDRELDELRERLSRAVSHTRRLEEDLELERRAESEAQHAAAAQAAACERLERALADREHVFAEALGAAEVELKAARDRLEHVDATAAGERAELEQRIAEVDADREHAEARLEHEQMMHAEVVAELGRRLTDEREHYEQNLATLRRQVEALHGQLDRSGTAFREQLSAERHARRAIEARLRLLETGTPRAARQGPVPWLPAALTRMAYDEPEAAGRLALSLLPGQSAVVTERLNYDVELHGAGWYRVSVGDGASEIVSMEGPRPRVHADFRVQTDGAGLVALIAHGDTSGLRVRATRRRRHARAVLCAVPATLLELYEAGARPAPSLVYSALVRGIAGDWTVGHEFAIEQELSDGDARCFIVVRDGRSVVVTETRPAAVTATVRLSYSTLAHLLSGEPPAPDDKPAVRGDALAVARLNGWLRRAQGLIADAAEVSADVRS